MNRNEIEIELTSLQEREKYLHSVLKNNPENWIGHLVWVWNETYSHNKAIILDSYEDEIFIDKDGQGYFHAEPVRYETSHIMLQHPSDGQIIPEWANYVAMDYDGTVKAFEFEPEAHATYWKAQGGHEVIIRKKKGGQDTWDTTLKRIQGMISYEEYSDIYTEEENEDC